VRRPIARLRQGASHGRRRESVQRRTAATVSPCGRSIGQEESHRARSRPCPPRPAAALPKRAGPTASAGNAATRTARPTVTSAARGQSARARHRHAGAGPTEHRTPDDADLAGRLALAPRGVGDCFEVVDPVRIIMRAGGVIHDEV